MAVDSPRAASPIRVLLVDDCEATLRAMSRALRLIGFVVEPADSAIDALEMLKTRSYAVVLSDIGMPGMDGIQLLQKIRDTNASIPVVLITGDPAVSTALQALESGAFHYLTKPASIETLRAVLARAVALGSGANARGRAAPALAPPAGLNRDEFQALFERALTSLQLSYEPLTVASTGALFGFEACVSSDEPALRDHALLTGAACYLNASAQLSSATWKALGPASADFDKALTLILRVTPEDVLSSSTLIAALAQYQIGDAIALEISERHDVDPQRLRSGLDALRERGARISLGELGSGYSGLSFFSALEPDIIRLDASLVDDIEFNQTKRKVVSSMCALAHDMSITVGAREVNRGKQKDVLLECGCNFLQGAAIGVPAVALPRRSRNDGDL